jgi:hypothetical protein
VQGGRREFGAQQVGNLPELVRNRFTSSAGDADSAASSTRAILIGLPDRTVRAA